MFAVDILIMLAVTGAGGKKILKVYNIGIVVFRHLNAEYLNNIS